MKDERKKSIAIIGAGAAGLTSAWLLEQDYAVTIFEQSAAVGGHAMTIPIPIDDATILIEAGAEFFCDQTAVYLNRMLKHLNIKTHYYPLSYTFYDTRSQDALILPPLDSRCFTLQEFTLDHVREMIALKKFVSYGSELVSTGDTQTTVEQLCEASSISTHFRSRFLYPFFAAGWGVLPHELAEFSAYDVLQWALKNQPHGMQAPRWFEIVPGTSSYIDALRSELTKTTIITNVSPTVAYDFKNGQYAISLNSQVSYYDYLIVATNAQQAATLLQSVEHAHALRAVLTSIEYFRTTIAIHSDSSYLPHDPGHWSIANIRYNGVTGALSVYKPWKGNLLIRSWITHDTHEPKSLHALEHFYHPKVTPAYFKAQQNLKPLQGMHGLWIAGFYTQGIDAHDSALASALSIAQQLCPDSPRSALLMPPAAFEV